MNVVILEGRLTADPELKLTKSGKEVASFSIAVDRRYQKGVTDFIRCVAWQQKSKFVCEYFKKGDGIAIEGSLQTQSYEDANGNKRSSTEVNVEEVHFPKQKPKNNDDRVEYDFATEGVFGGNNNE